MRRVFFNKHRTKTRTQLTKNLVSGCGAWYCRLPAARRPLMEMAPPLSTATHPS